MSKKKLMFSIFLLAMFFIGIVDTFAQSKDYYINKNGVKITKKEYDFIYEFYGNDYFEKMTNEEYDWIADLNIDNNDVEIVKDSNIMPLATDFTQHGRRITIAKSCSANCIIIVNCKWTTLPSVRSYDVIGARFVDTNLVGNIITTKVTSSAGVDYFDNLRKLSNGFGVSIKLPSSATGISIEQKYTVSKGGTIYATHQHASKNISLATSKLYAISSSGYGKVFSFYGDAYDVFDEMGGLQITT